MLDRQRALDDGRFAFAECAARARGHSGAGALLRGRVAEGVWRMAYKGNDLDLWTARSVSLAEASSQEHAANGIWTQAAKGSSGPIVVDEAVLACCNGAYDVAQFHASDTVRLEHLLHALTRVASATDVLAEVGI